MKKTVQDLKVISSTRLNEDHALLVLESTIALEKIYPGQFANILVDKSSAIFLRRPFSIHQVDYKCNTLSFLIKGVGEGTKCLANTTVGESLNLVFPLGNGFTIPVEKANLLLVGGGCGVAPLLLLANVLYDAGHKVTILLGAKSGKDLVELEKYALYGTVQVTTEDGSLGVKGFVTDHPDLKDSLSQFDKIFTCGPEPMMRAVAAQAKLNDLDCEVSLENTMACGYGVCLCCVTETIEGNRCVCTDGPVFNIKRLKWQI